jgi:hypothetical protein
MSDAKIFLLGGGDGKLLSMTAVPYDAEAVLQKFVADYPELLPGDQIDPVNPRRWLLVRREMSVPGEEGKGGKWSLDHLLLDQDAIPTFVECKRASNTEIRREIVAQMLDYAANGLKYWSMEDLRTAAAETAKKAEKDLDDMIRALCDRSPEEDVGSYWRDVETNLRLGRIRLVFVADEIPPDLRCLVEFLNDKMRDDVEVLAVEIKQFTGPGQTALVPRVVGFKEKPARAQPALPTTRERFLVACPPERRSLFAQVLDRAVARGYTIKWGRVTYSLRASFPSGPVPFMDAYPDSCLYFKFKDLPVGKSDKEQVCAELDKSGVFYPPGRQYMRLRLEEDEQKVLDAVEAIFKLIDSLVANATPGTTATPAAAAIGTPQG